jgi:peptide/nickel transport system substrate-binding protein
MYVRVATLLLLLILQGCADREPRAVRGGTLVVAAPNDLDFANPLVSANRYTMEILRSMLFVPLMRHDEQLGFSPALASSWELLGDTGAVFHLRRDVRWHDGRLTTAHDVVFTFQRAMDPLTAFPNADYFTGWNPAVATDSFTVRVTFRAQPEPLAGLAFLTIAPQHLLDSVPPERLRQATFNQNPVGNGPFRFVSQRSRDRWIFDSNPQFPEDLGGPPNLERFVWRVIPETAAQTAELQSGGVQVVLKPLAKQFDDMRRKPGMQGIIRPSRLYAFIGWNGKRPPFNDARVRRALTMALDRRQILDALRGGHGELATGPVAPFHWAYDKSLQPLPFDRDSARALLAEAGFADRQLRFELKIPAGDDVNRDLAEMMRAQFAEVGVQMTTTQVDFSALLGDVTSPERKFDAALMGWESDFKLNMRDLFHSSALSGPFQLASFSDPRVDSILDQTATITRREESLPLWRRFEQIMRESQPWSFLFYYPDLILLSDRVRGVRMDIRGVLVNVPEWWLAPAKND